MWIRVEAAATCGVSREVTPVNAAVGRIACDDCGADIALRMGDAALAEVGETAAELVANDTRGLSWSQGSAELRATLTRESAHSPH